MTSFHSTREAKEFLVATIVEEASKENIVLSDIERKMLYFSETGWTLPDMLHISDTFDRTQGQNEYEQKIARLIGGAVRRVSMGPQGKQDDWRAAVQLLDKEDHYITLLIKRAGLRPSGDLLKLWGTGLMIVMALLLCMFVSIKYGIDLGAHLPSRRALGVYMWAGAACALIGYQLFRFVLGARTFDALIVKVADEARARNLVVWLISIGIILLLFILMNFINLDGAPVW